MYLGRGLKMKGLTNENDQKLKGLAKDKIFKLGWQIYLIRVLSKLMPLLYYHNGYAKCDFEENQNSFWDMLLEKTHMKEKYDTKCNDLLFEAQNLISSSTKFTIAYLNNIRA